LPTETTKLAIAMTGQRDETAWDVKASPIMDFYDIKGRIERLLAGFRSRMSPTPRPIPSPTCTRAKPPKSK
jgi:phenylalanyl-tRNA synthetase beta subunit